MGIKKSYPAHLVTEKFVEQDGNGVEMKGTRYIDPPELCGHFWVRRIMEIHDCGLNIERYEVIGSSSGRNLTFVTVDGKPCLEVWPVLGAHNFIARRMADELGLDRHLMSVATDESD